MRQYALRLLQTNRDTTFDLKYAFKPSFLLNNMNRLKNIIKGMTLKEASFQTF